MEILCSLLLVLSVFGLSGMAICILADEPGFKVCTVIAFASIALLWVLSPSNETGTVANTPAAVERTVTEVPREKWKDDITELRSLVEKQNRIISEQTGIISDLRDRVERNITAVSNNADSIQRNGKRMDEFEKHANSNSRVRKQEILDRVDPRKCAITGETITCSVR